MKKIFFITLFLVTVFTISAQITFDTTACQLKILEASVVKKSLNVCDVTFEQIQNTSLLTASTFRYKDRTETFSASLAAAGFSTMDSAYIFIKDLRGRCCVLKSTFDDVPVSFLNDSVTVRNAISFANDSVTIRNLVNDSVTVRNTLTTANASSTRSLVTSLDTILAGKRYVLVENTGLTVALIDVGNGFDSLKSGDHYLFELLYDQAVDSVFYSPQIIINPNSGECSKTIIE